MGLFCLHFFGFSWFWPSPWTFAVVANLTSRRSTLFYHKCLISCEIRKQKNTVSCLSANALNGQNFRESPRRQTESNSRVKLTHFANEWVFSSERSFACNVQPVATISQHFSAVFFVEKVVGFAKHPSGKCKWFSIVPVWKAPVWVTTKPDP